MTTMASVDDLFRQKTLQEIHGVLKQTRSEVEAKKQELRELVGDHYRSVLESSDHIRAMSECAAKVSTGADHIEELIASMRVLAANPPTLSGGLLPQAPAKEEPEADHEYRVSLSVMELLEVPDIVGAHLHEHRFVRAARVALVDATTLQSEVDDLLRPGVHDAESSPGTFNFGALARQQAAAFRCLPSQISASCEDAFSASSLAPESAAESFAVRLVLDASQQPTSLLRLFLERRRELVRSLLASSSQSSEASGARLAAAAVAFEGTVVLSASLCQGSLEKALVAVYEGAPDRDALEERAAITGQTPSGTGFSSLRKRSESLGLALRRGGSAADEMLAELGTIGAEITREWVPSEAAGLSSKSGTSSGSSPRSLASFFFQLVSADRSLRACTALGETLTHCTEKVLSYRRVLSQGSSGSWSSVWAASCQNFCPGRPPLDDALSIVTTAVEAACIEVVRERVGELQLELVPSSEDDGDALDAASPNASDAGGHQGGDVRRRAEVYEMQRQSRLRVQRLDELLGEILEDLGHVALPGSGEGLSSGVSGALLEALCERLSVACEAVRLPIVAPLWPSIAKDASAAATDAPCSWPRQRSAARAAIAFDALLAAAADLRDGEELSTSHLRATLRSASSSGDSSLMRQAQGILEQLQQQSDAAYNVWARLAVSHDEGTATLNAFWQLADDEVRHACGWGNATFAQKGKGGAVSGDDSSKAVPVPVQASSFVFERLTIGARRALEVSGGFSPMSRALVVALKVALSESFMAAYEAHPTDFEKLKHSSMSHLLQWLFDLRFLQIALSGHVESQGKAYEALCQLHDRAEAATLSDPVDRLLYQEVLKSSVKGHIEGVKILLAPFFLHNPRYGFLFPGQSSGGVEIGGLGRGASTSVEDEGFELQTTFAPPLRPMLPQRFPLLPVAMTSALAGGSSAELDARLGLSADSAERAAARMAGANPSAPSVSSLMQSVGSGLGSSIFGKSFGWGGGPGGTKPPQAV